MTTSTLIQYTIVGIIVAGACIWAGISVVRQMQGKKSSCSGCSLSQACEKKKLRSRSSELRQQSCTDRKEK